MLGQGHKTVCHKKQTQLTCKSAKYSVIYAEVRLNYYCGCIVLLLLFLLHFLANKARKSQKQTKPDRAAVEDGPEPKLDKYTLC